MKYTTTKNVIKYNSRSKQYVVNSYFTPFPLWTSSSHPGVEVARTSGARRCPGYQREWVLRVRTWGAARHGWWGLGLWPRWCWDGLLCAWRLSRWCRLRETEACRRASLMESRRGGSSRGCAGEDRIPSGGKRLVHNHFPTNMLLELVQRAISISNLAAT